MLYFLNLNEEKKIKQNRCVYNLTIIPDSVLLGVKEVNITRVPQSLLPEFLWL